MANPCVLLLLGAVFSKGVMAMDFRCPPRETISPCMCIPNSLYFLGVRIFCYDVNRFGQLAELVRSLRNLKIDTLQLHNLSMSSLPTGIWEDVWIRQIAIIDSELDSLTPGGTNPFTELGKSMNELSIVRSNISQGLDFAALRSNLNILTVDNVRVPRLSSTVADVGPLIRLTVTGCGVEAMDDDVFSTLTELDEIHLSDNRLQKVTRSMLPRPASRLHTIDLSRNKIRSLPSDVFSDIPHLAFLFLDGNDLTTLPATLEHVWKQLITVRLAENPFQCSCQLMDFFSALYNSKPRDNDVDNIICAGPGNLAGHKLVALEREDTC